MPTNRNIVKIRVSMTEIVACDDAIDDSLKSRNAVSNSEGKAPILIELSTGFKSSKYPVIRMQGYLITCTFKVKSVKYPAFR